MRKLLLFSVLAISLTIQSQGQGLYLKRDTSLSLQKYLHGALIDEISNSGNDSLNTFGFVRFKIDTAGHMRNLSFSETIEDSFQSWFKNIAGKQNYCKKEPRKGNNNKEVLYLLPIAISINTYPLERTISAIDFINSLKFVSNDKKIIGSDSEANFGEDDSITEYIQVPAFFFSSSDKHKPFQKLRKGLDSIISY
ncbi:MAG TPA: hypothetical protein PLS00_17805 [Niabella sp.]|nr:hypothetical protein [Niabella sp.]